MRLILFLIFLCGATAHAQNPGGIQVHGTAIIVNNIKSSSMGLGYGIGVVGPVSISVGVDASSLKLPWVGTSVDFSVNGPQQTYLGVEGNYNIQRGNSGTGTAIFLGVNYGKSIFEIRSTQFKGTSSVEARVGINFNRR